MVTIPKLPALEPEMKGALLRHIMRKRQRMKQEMEQDAIERRLKKEREHKRIQDAMSLDQIKEQLTDLEKKLETLRCEKHDLFVQLKQVLKEGSSKRKQVDSTTTTAITEPTATNEQKRKKTEENSKSEKTDASTNVVPFLDNKVAFQGNHRSERTSRITYLDQPLQDLNQQQRSQSMKNVSQSSPATASGSMKTTQPAHYTSPMHNTSKPIQMSQSQQFEMIGSSRHDPLPSATINNNSQNLAALQAQVGYSFSGTSASAMPPELLTMSSRLQSNYQNIPPNESHKLPMNQMHQNVPLSLSHESDMLAGSFSSQSTASGITAMSKVLPPFSAHPDQFFIDNGLSPNFVHFNLLTHGLALGNLGLPQMSVGASVTPGSPNIPLTPANLNRLKSLPNQIPNTGLDYSSTSQTKSGATGVGLPPPGCYSPAYPSQSSSHSSSPSAASMYHGQEYNPLLQTSNTGLQQVGRPMRHHNLASSRLSQPNHHHQPQHDQASRTSFPNSSYHKRPSRKNPYYPNRLYDYD